MKKWWLAVDQQVLKSKASVKFFNGTIHQYMEDKRFRWRDMQITIFFFSPTLFVRRLKELHFSANFDNSQLNCRPRTLQKSCRFSVAVTQSSVVCVLTDSNLYTFPGPNTSTSPVALRLLPTNRCYGEALFTPTIRARHGISDRCV